MPEVTIPRVSRRSTLLTLLSLTTRLEERRGPGTRIPPFGRASRAFVRLCRTWPRRKPADSGQKPGPTASTVVPHHSLPAKAESSFITHCLLSKRDPLRWAPVWWGTRKWRYGMKQKKEVRITLRLTQEQYDSIAAKRKQPRCGGRICACGGSAAQSSGDRWAERKSPMSSRASDAASTNWWCCATWAGSKKSIWTMRGRHSSQVYLKLRELAEQEGGPDGYGYIHSIQESVRWSASWSGRLCVSETENRARGRLAVGQRTKLYATAGRPGVHCHPADAPKGQPHLGSITMSSPSRRTRRSPERWRTSGPRVRPAGVADSEVIYRHPHGRRTHSTHFIVNSVCYGTGKMLRQGDQAP